MKTRPSDAYFTKTLIAEIVSDNPSVTDAIVEKSSAVHAISLTDDMLHDMNFGLLIAVQLPGNSVLFLRIEDNS